MSGRSNVGGGIDTTDATVVASDMKVGVTAYGAAGTKITGTMTVHAVDQTASSITNSTTTLKFLAPAGFYDGTKYVNFTDADFAAGNIRVGYNIFGIDGTFTNDATATAGQILATVTAYVNGAKITGTMTNQGALNYTPGTSNQSIASGYHNGSGVVYGDADLLADNIKSGVNIFGIVGTYSNSGSIIYNTKLGETNNLANSKRVYITVAQNKTVTISTLTASSDFSYMYLLDGSGNLTRTSNGGKTWTVTNIGSSYKVLRCSSNGLYVYAFGGGGIKFMYSTDGGANFATHATVGGWGDCSADGSIVYGTITNTIYKSTNYGVTMNSTGISCYTDTSFSTPLQAIKCSDDGSTVYYLAITTGYLMKTTDGLATAGSSVRNSNTNNASFQISQDGTKWGVYGLLSNAVVPADSYNVLAMFNNGDHLLYSGSNIRCCDYTTNTYWSNLSTILPTNNASDALVRVKGLDAHIGYKGGVVFAIGC